MKPWQLRGENGGADPDLIDTRDCCGIMMPEPRIKGLVWTVNPAGQAYYSVHTDEGLVPLHDLIDYDGMGG